MAQLAKWRCGQEHYCLQLARYGVIVRHLNRCNILECFLVLHTNSWSSISNFASCVSFPLFYGWLFRGNAEDMFLFAGQEVVIYFLSKFLLSDDRARKIVNQAGKLNLNNRWSNQIISWCQFSNRFVSILPLSAR